MRRIATTTATIALLTAGIAGTAAAQEGPARPAPEEYAPYASPPPPVRPEPQQAPAPQPAPQPQPNYYYAQPPVYQPPPPPGFSRGGFLIGFGFGPGRATADCLGCDEGDTGGSLSFHLGGMIGPELALVGEIWIATAPVDEHRSFVGSSLSALLRWFPGQRFWLQGGLGLGSFGIGDDRCQGDDDDFDKRSARAAVDFTCPEPITGGAIIAGAGYEVYQGTTFALDLSLELAAGDYEDVSSAMGSVRLGFNWY